jgi:hypothetical protein
MQNRSGLFTAVHAHRHLFVASVRNVARPFGRSFLGSFLGRLAKDVPTVYTCEHRHEDNQLSEGSTEAQTFDTFTGFRG